jgi:hypothetical protein
MMAKGTDLARPFAPAHAAAIDAMKEQLLIVFLKRLGGTASIPVAEIDDTGGDLFAFHVTDRVFHFSIQKKH